jgi:hypothetical protein
VSIRTRKLQRKEYKYESNLSPGFILPCIISTKDTLHFRQLPAEFTVVGPLDSLDEVGRMLAASQSPHQYLHASDIHLVKHSFPQWIKRNTIHLLRIQGRNLPTHVSLANCLLNKYSKTNF